MSLTSIDPRKNVALMASAGTGKTYNLALRAVAILMMGGKVTQAVYSPAGEKVVDTIKYISDGKILCITFTKKATAEMAERVREYLSGLAAGKYKEDDHKYVAIAEILGINNMEDMKKSAAKAMDRVFRDSTLLQIRTIDSFTTHILRLFPFEADQHPDFGITNETADEELQKQALRNTFRHLPEPVRYVNFFIKNIKWRNTNPNTFIRDLNTHTAWILENAVELENELSKAAEFTISDLETILAESISNDEKIRQTLKKIAAYFLSPVMDGRVSAPALRRVEGMIDVENVKEYIENDEIKILTFLHPEKAKKNKNNPMPDDYLLLYDEFVEFVKIHLAKRERLEVFLLLHIAGIVQKNIEQLKKERNLLSFADLTRIVYNLFYKKDEYAVDKEYLYFRLDGRLEHILVDEFQDTSAAQWAIIEPLVLEAVSGLSDKLGSFFCVGDTKQTIYRFRGSNLGFFHSVAEDYKEWLNMEKLLVNHRSDKAIVEFTNLLFQNADDRINHDEIIFDYTPQEAYSTAEGYVSIMPISGKNKKEYDTARIFQLEQAIDELIQKNFRYNDITILVTKRDSGKLAQKYLEGRNIPCYLGFGTSLAASPVFAVIRHLAEYMHHKDSFILANFLLTHPSVVSNSKITHPKAFERYKSVLDMHLSRTEGLPVYKRMMDIGKRLSLAGRFAGNADYFALLDIIALNLASVTNPLVFIEALTEFAANTPLPDKGGDGGVAIMTVHGAKGLQFPAVILFNVKEKMVSGAHQSYFINIRNSQAKIYKQFRTSLRPFATDENRQAFEREQALIRYDKINQLYVAVTRAKHALYVIAGDEKDSTDKYVLEYFPKGTQLGVLQALEREETPKPKERHVKKYREILFSEPVVPEADAEYTEPAVARYFGIFLHEAIYQMAEFEREFIPAAISKAWNRYGGFLPSSDMVRGADILGRLCDNEDWRGIISGRQIFREKVISYNGAVLVTDMYALDERSVNVVDFKTSAPDTLRGERYAEQILRYKTALEGHYNLPVNAYVIYLYGEGTSVRATSVAAILT